MQFTSEYWFCSKEFERQKRNGLQELDVGFVYTDIVVIAAVMEVCFFLAWLVNF